jgi:hypothetical protein
MWSRSSRPRSGGPSFPQRASESAVIAHEVVELAESGLEGKMKLEAAPEEIEDSVECPLFPALNQVGGSFYRADGFIDCVANVWFWPLSEKHKGLPDVRRDEGVEAAFS